MDEHDFGTLVFMDVMLDNGVALPQQLGLGIVKGNSNFILGTLAFFLCELTPTSLHHNLNGHLHVAQFDNSNSFNLWLALNNFVL